MCGMGCRVSDRRSSSEIAESPLNVRKQPNTLNASRTTPARRGAQCAGDAHAQVFQHQGVDYAGPAHQIGYQGRGGSASPSPRRSQVSGRWQQGATARAGPPPAARQTIAYIQNVSVCEAMIRGRRPIRSASRPPKPPTSSEGIERQNPTSPTRPAESVSSSTSQLSTIISM